MSVLRNLVGGVYGSSRRRCVPSRRATNHRRLGVESLEDRRMLTGTWNALASPVPNGDGAQLMMLLSDGNVMVHGGGGNASSTWYKLTPNGNDYLHGTWSTLAPMNAGRLFFGSNVLPNGRVLVVGGEYAPGDPNGAGSNLSSAEIYDPVTNIWSNTTDFNTTGNANFGDDPTAMLPGGTLLAGYISGTNTYRFNPMSANPTWTATIGGKLHGDQSDEESWVTLPDDSVLSYDVFGSTTTQGNSQRYVPSQDRWVEAGMMPFVMSSAAVGSELGPAFLMPPSDGRVWFAGGNGNTGFYNIATNSWSAGTSIPNGYVAADAPGAMLPNGHVLIAASPLGSLSTGGGYLFPKGTKVYEFNPTGLGGPGGYAEVTPGIPGFDLSTATGVNSYQTSMLVLPNGHVLMCNDTGKVIEYTPDGGPNNAWRPVISNITTVGLGVFHVTGTQLTGISEGAAYGDDNEMSSNYPIVQLQNSAGAIAYARSFNWQVGVQKGSTPQSFDFSLPIGWNPDAYLMTVSAAGISSGTVLNIQMAGNISSPLTLQQDFISSSLVDVVSNGVVESVWALGSYNSMIVSGSSSDDLITLNYNFAGRPIAVNGYGGNDIIRVEANGSPTYIFGDDGNDSIDFSYYNHNLSSISSSTTVMGGAGIDSVFCYDWANASAAFFIVTAPAILRAGWGGLIPEADIENVTLNSGTAADTVAVISTNQNQHLYLNSAGGHDIVNIGGAGGAQGVLGSVEIHNDPNYSTVTVNDTSDPTSRAVQIDNSGGFGVMIGLTPGQISWVNNDISDMTVTTGVGADVMAIRANSRPFTILNSGGVDDISLGNGLNGLQSIVGALTIHAFYGVGQRLTLDDTADAVGRSTTLIRSNIDYSLPGLSPGLITYRDFGSMRLFEGSGGDSFSYTGDISHALSVSGNGGNDSFTLTTLNNWFEYIGGSFTLPATFDGGTGFNTFSINDVARGNANYQFYADRIYSIETPLFSQGADFNYDNMSSIALACSNVSNALAVYGTSSDIAVGNQISIALGGGNDAVTLYPHDAQGNLTINGTLGIGGGTGTDSLTINDTASSLPINYLFQNLFGAGTTNIAGLGAAGFGAGSDLETISINAGDGDDTFAIDQFMSGAGLGINAGGGDDVLQFGNNGLAAITSLASFSFNGGPGTDTFNLNNQTHSGTWTYTRNLGSIAASSSLGGGYFLTDSNTELMRLNGGPSGETFNVNAVAAGTRLDVRAAGGVDILRLGSSTNSVDSIQGLISYDAGPNGGSVVVFDTADTTGDTFHLTPTELGGYPYDNLFGTGGSLSFSGLTDINVIAPAMLIHLGSGSDTAYAQPLASGTTTINFNGQNAADAVGDALNLALAADANYVITGTSSGNVVSDTSGQLNWNGVELPLQVDDLAPFIVSQSYDGSAEPTILVEFSEYVADSLSFDDMQLINTTTGEPVPSSVMGLSYDAGTNTASFTFPGYPGGVLPAGDYSATILTTVTDFFGNQMVGTIPLTFHVGGLVGDFNGDLILDGADIDALVMAIVNGGSPSVFDLTGDGLITPADRDQWLALAGAANLPSGNAYLLGDANLDGVVDGQDFIAWNTHKFSSSAQWTNGDFTADGVVDGQDFIAWNTNKFQSAVPLGQPPQADHPFSSTVLNQRAMSPDAIDAVFTRGGVKVDDGWHSRKASLT